MKILITESQLNELTKEVKCENCGWSWKLSEGGDEPHTCHKCGHNNKIEGDIDEVDLSYHYYKQIFKRWVKNLELPVLLFSFRRGKMTITEIGHHSLSNDIKNKVEEKLNVLKKYDVGSEFSFGVIIEKFKINPSEIKFKDSSTKLMVYDELLNKGGTLYYRDDETKSTGDTLVAVVRNNNVTSIFYSYSYSLSPEKLRVDYLLDDVYELENYVQ